MGRSEQLFWRWIESYTEESDWHTTEGLLYIHKQSTYISPIVEVSLTINESTITCVASVPETEEEAYTIKYPGSNEWAVSWKDLQDQGFSSFLRLLEQNAQLEHLKGED